MSCLAITFLGAGVNLETNEEEHYAILNGKHRLDISEEVYRFFLDVAAETEAANEAPPPPDEPEERPRPPRRAPAESPPSESGVPSI